MSKFYESFSDIIIKNQKIFYINETRPLPSENISIIIDQKEIDFDKILKESYIYKNCSYEQRLPKSQPINIPGMVESKTTTTLSYFLLKEIYEMSSISSISPIIVSSTPLYV